MNVSKNINLLQNNLNFVVQGKGKLESKEAKEEKKEMGGSIYAGNLDLAKVQDEMAGKQARAQKRALKGILDCFSQEMDTNEIVENCKEKKKELSAQGVEANAQIKKIENQSRDLKENYGITEDSEEEKNLKLLEKSLDPRQKLTEEEKEQLAAMGPLTDYQKSALELDAAKGVWEKRLSDANDEKTEQSGIIEGIKQEKLKSHPMADAQVEAKKIMDAVTKEIVAGVWQYAKAATDDEMEKKKEEGQEQAKKAEEKQQQAGDDSTNTAQDSTNENLSEVQQADTDQKKLQTEVKNLIDKLNITEEDSKGILVTYLL